LAKSGNKENSMSGKMVSVTRKDVLENIDDILKSRAPLYRKKRDNSLVTIPPDRLEHFIGESSSENIPLFMLEGWQMRLRNYRSMKQDPGADKITVGPRPQQTPEDHVFIRELKHFTGMTLPEREDVLDENLELLRSHIARDNKLNLKSVTEIVDVVAKTVYVNRASMDENNGTEDFKRNMNGVLAKTNQFIKSMVSLVENESVEYQDLGRIEDISTGSSTMDHMNKVMIRFVPFCSFYNDYFSRGLIKKMRALFRKKYIKYYSQLLPDAKDISLEVVFKDGIRRITKSEMEDYTLGAMLHDIGKLPDIEYHDGSEGYNPKLVIKHAPVSYNMIVQAGLPWKIAALAALHHEYYDNQSGYNVSKALFSHFRGRGDYEVYRQYVISYNADDIKRGHVLAYFPCKMLEIIDVFDALTDRTRKYRSDYHTIEEALVIMKDEFIVDNLKLDPILFDIFLEFVKEYATLERPQVIDELLFRD